MTRHRPEQQIQKALADHLRFRAAPGIYWFHPANGGARTAIEGAILKACGVRASTPDLICIGAEGPTGSNSRPRLALPMRK